MNVNRTSLCLRPRIGRHNIWSLPPSSRPQLNSNALPNLIASNSARHYTNCNQYRFGPVRILFVLFTCLLSLFAQSSRAQGTITITGVASNIDSVKVRYLPVPGAMDYRIYDKNNPSTVKYAGVWHIFSPWSYLFQTNSQGLPIIPDALVVPIGNATSPYEMDEPALEIEMNGLTPNTPYTLVLEAVNILGPVAGCCMYDVNNNPVVTCPPGCPGCKLGMNSCCTRDGKISTNGQGASTNNPTAIASTTVNVTASAPATLPSSILASQVLFDTFDSGTITPTGAVDPVAGVALFSLQTPAAAWQIRTENADTRDSLVTLDHKHFMDILFDDGTPGTNDPLHQGHGVLALSPNNTLDFSGGQIAHLTMEVDAHTGPSRRYVDFRMTPANDPYILLGSTLARINNTDTDVVVQFTATGIAVDEHLGVNPTDPNAAPIDITMVGPLGQGVFSDNGRPNLTLETNGFQNGRGLDNRSRLDAFISSTHFAIYEDGIKITEHDFATPLPFTSAKVYYSHYHYHSAIEVQELMQTNPWETYWISTFPYSDERHWDNIGYEVLPANTSWSSLTGLVQPPAFQSPAPIANSAAFVGTDSTTQGSWKGKYGSDGYNIINDAISYPSYASVNMPGTGSYTGTSSSNNVVFLQKVSIPGDRLAAWMYGYPAFTIDVNLIDGKAHKLSIYNMDPGATGSQTIQIADANTGAVLDTQVVSAFTNGIYTTWNLTGHVHVNYLGNSPLLSGFFFDPATGTATTVVPSSVTLNPSSVLGGASSTATVTLSGAAPTGGQIVTLSTSSPASVPATVTVAAGSTQATFNVSTTAVTSTATPAITATANGTAVSGTLTVTAPVLFPTGITLSPTSVTGGTSSTGTVNISSAAPTGGQIVNLSTSSPASVPATVTVAAGSTQATFTVTTTAVTTTATTSVTATVNTTSASATLTVTGASRTPTAVTFSPNSVTGGSPSTGTVTLSGAAPTGGQMVSLGTSSPASTPTTVMVPAGSTQATFTVTTTAVTATATPAITATANGTSAAGNLTVSPAAATSSATFVGIDATTQGSWVGKYGNDGYDVMGDTSSVPSYVAGTVIGQSSWTWASSTNDIRAPQRGSNHSGRLASCWFSATSFTMDLNLTDGKVHQVSYYCLDWDYTIRTQTIQIVDAATGTVLDTESVSAFHSGKYLIWNIKGHVQVKFTNTCPASNALVEGIYFDSVPVSTSASATYVTTDTSTQGSWIGKYGSKGYNVTGDITSYPSYATVALSGQSPWTWAANTSDVRAPQKASKPSSRLASCLFSATSFTVDLNLTDGQTHQVGFYCLDWDFTIRTQTVQVIDAATGTVLNTQSLASFHNGKYMIWNIKGHVQVKFTNTCPISNALIEGIFFD